MPTAPLIKFVFLFAFLPCLAMAEDTPTYPLHYKVSFDPEADQAHVVIELDHDGLVREIDFNIDPERHTDIEANGELEIKKGRAIWQPPEKDARLSLKAKISHKRKDDSYDALMTKDWAIFRGDDLVPAARVKTSPGAESRARLSFELPEHWTSVSTGWERIDGPEFAIDNPERRFSRPTGWMIAGRLGTRTEQLGNTKLAVSAPRGSDLRRMDVLTFLNVVWPELESAFGTSPPYLTIVGHGDPMWRGGLSGPNSLFLHASRPLVSENGTSSLVHELVHVITRIDGKRNHDWIVEGLAEFYSFELLHRAGAMTTDRRDYVLASLEDWSQDVETLIERRSTGATTARAVLLFEELDRELRACTEGEKSLDDVVRELMEIREVSLKDLRRVSEQIAGRPVKALDQEVLEAQED